MTVQPVTPISPGQARAGLDARIQLRLGSLDLDVALQVAPGEVVAVLGPNGAGKSTLLRALSGLLPVANGTITVGGRLVEDTATGVRLAARHRGVGVMFQDHLLFPNLTVLENVAFGLRSRGVGRREARRRAHAWLAAVDLRGYAESRPGVLSGGQARRAALARALVADPALLMLDEPFSALDVAARRTVRQQLRRHLEDFVGPVILITHEPLEAITLADRLVIIEKGRLVQDDTPEAVARRPRSAWAARLVGLNLYRAHAHGDRLTLPGGATLTVADAASEPGEVLVAIHPRAVALHAQQPHGSPRNTWQGTVDSLDVHDDQIRVHVDGPIPLVAQITLAAFAELAIVEGDQLWVAIKATEIDHWPA